MLLVLLLLSVLMMDALMRVLGVRLMMGVRLEHLYLLLLLPNRLHLLKLQLGQLRGRLAMSLALSLHLVALPLGMSKPLGVSLALGVSMALGVGVRVGVRRHGKRRTLRVAIRWWWPCVHLLHVVRLAVAVGRRVADRELTLRREWKLRRRPRRQWW